MDGDKVQLLFNELKTQYKIVSQHSDELLYSVITVGTNDLLYHSFFFYS